MNIEGIQRATTIMGNAIALLVKYTQEDEKIGWKVKEIRDLFLENFPEIDVPKL